MHYPSSLPLERVKVFPLAERRSLTQLESILVDPDAPAPACSPSTAQAVSECARRIREARANGASVMLIYGAHLLRNGAAQILDRMMAHGWLTHLATNGAGTIHDWEYAWFGASTESVEMNVASGTLRHVGRNGAPTFTSRSWPVRWTGWATAARWAGSSARMARRCRRREELARRSPASPTHPLTSARADLLRAMREQAWPAGPQSTIEHRWKHASILARLARHGVPVTVHPGIGYDIIANHPMFSGSVIGRAAELDFKLFGGSVEGLDGGVVLSVGSAIMGPQVFEKSVSCVNNLRLQDGRHDRRATTDLRGRSAGRRRLGLDAGRAAEDQPGLLPALLQKLFAHGRDDALLQCDKARSSTPFSALRRARMTPERSRNHRALCEAAHCHRR